MQGPPASRWIRPSSRDDDDATPCASNVFLPMSTISAQSTLAIVAAAAAVTARNASPRSCRPLGGLRRSPRALIRPLWEASSACFTMPRVKAKSRGQGARTTHATRDCRYGGVKSTFWAFGRYLGHRVADCGSEGQRVWPRMWVRAMRAANQMRVPPSVAKSVYMSGLDRTPVEASTKMSVVTVPRARVRLPTACPHRE